jgi:hypothetical protein
MKKLFLILFLVVGYFANGQILQEPNVYGYKFKRVGSDSLHFIPSDTLQVPTRYNGLSFIANKGGALYYWNGTKWASFSSSGSSYTFTNGLTESGGVVSWDSTNVYNEIGAKADTSDMLTIDTTGVQDGYVATWDTAGADRVVFAAPTGGSTDSTWHISFKTEVTPGAPNGGDSTFIHPYLEGKVLDIYRDGVRQSILSNQYSITINSLVFHPPLDSAEVVEIVIKDSTRHRWLTINEVISEQDIGIDSYQGNLTESPDNQWNFSSNTKFAATATKMTGDGYVKLQTTGQSIIVSLDATTDLEAHTYPFLFNYAFWVNNSVLWVAYLDLQNPPAGINLGSTNGMTHFKLIRLSGEVKLYGSTDGVTFNLLYTYPNTYNGDLYFKGINVDGGTGVIINPKSYGFE